MEITKEKNIILNFLDRYKTETQCRGVVLGLSGGKDSTVVAMLAKKVWGDNVLCLSMPNGKQTDLQDAIDIASALNIEHKIVNIETIYNNLIHVVENKIPTHTHSPDFEQNCPPITSKAKTNISPRIRMTILYAVAQSIGYRVIGTSNYSETYIGWSTKWGDSAYDINPIAHLTCTEVIELGKNLAEEFGLDKKYIIKTPADGLTGKSDEENFGFSYRELDDVINGKKKDETITNMFDASKHKRLPPLKLPRMNNEVF